MNTLSFTTLPPPWAVPFFLAAHLAAGLALGTLHFGSLWWNIRLFSIHGHTTMALLVMLGRVAVLGGVLSLISFEGAPPLLATALGVFLARSVVTRRVRGNAL